MAKKKEVFKQRMYHLVLYSLSPIQKGIQAYHSGIEFANHYFKTPEFQRWAKKDKTVIILNGGTSNTTGTNLYNKDIMFGSMDKSLDELCINRVKCSKFYEPDCNNALTAISFLVSEKVWDKTNYPDLLKISNEDDATEVLNKEYINKELVKEHQYTKEELFLKEFLRQFNLAN